MTFHPMLVSPFRQRVDANGQTARRWSTSRNVRVSMGAIALLTNLALLNIRASAATGELTRIAGTGQKGMVNGRFDGAKFSTGWALEDDGAGNLFVGDNTSVRKISLDGTVSTLAGSETPGYADGDAAQARFNGARGMAVDTAGNVFVADTKNHAIRKISPSGVVTTLAGTGTPGATDGPGIGAQFNEPTDVAIDAAANVYVADSQNRLIRKIDAAGIVSTVVGPGDFKSPTSIAVDRDGNLFVADFDGALNPSRVAKISPTGQVSTLAGPQTGHGFFLPFTVDVDAKSNVIVADTFNNRILSISQRAVVTVVAGDPIAGFRDPSTTTAKFRGPEGLATGPNGEIYVMDGQKPLTPGAETPIVWSM